MRITRTYNKIIQCLKYAGIRKNVHTFMFITFNYLVCCYYFVREVYVEFLHNRFHEISSIRADIWLLSQGVVHVGFVSLLRLVYPV